MRTLGVVMITVAVCRAQAPEMIAKQLKRLGEEAEVFAMMAPKIIGEEKLEQVAAELPRYQPRGTPPPLKFRTRQIVSEYAFTTLKEDAGNLHEIRHVQTVDGKRVKPPGKLRETLTLGLKGETDRLKKNMLKEFQSYGLREAAMDFGQMILMFLPRQQENYTFKVLRTEFLGADRVAVVGYEQKGGEASMTVFEGRQVKKHPLQGEVWMRASDGVPLRITFDTSRAEKGYTLRHFARVDYEMSGYGCLMPVSAAYAESIAVDKAEGKVFVENRFQYGNYKMFGASSEVKFTAEDDPPDPKAKADPQTTPATKK